MPDPTTTPDPVLAGPAPTINEQEQPVPTVQPGSQQAPNDTNWHPHNFFGKLLAPLVDATGKGEKTTVDDSGNINTDVTQAAPGTMFKRMLVGALSGMGTAAQHRGLGIGGGAGVGFLGGEQQAQEQQDRQREQAVQSFQLRKAAQAEADKHQAATDAHAAAGDESHLRAAEIAYHNASTAELGFKLHAETQEQQEAMFKQQSGERDYMLKNGGTVAKQDISWADAQKAMAADPSLSHSVHAYLVGEKPVLDDNGQQLMEPKKDTNGNTILDATTNKPVMVPKMEYRFDLVQTPDDHTLTAADVKRYSKAGLPGFDANTVKAGQTISGSRWFNLENQLQDKNRQEWNDENIKAEIASRRATAAAESERAADLADEIKDKKLAKETRDDWGAALAANDNDPVKSSAWLRQNKPQSFQRLAAAESMDIANNGEVTTLSSPDGTTKTVVKKQRLFTNSAPQLTPQKQAATLTTVKSLVGTGMTRDQIQAQLQQAWGDNTAAVMKYLDDNNAFTAQPDASSAGINPVVKQAVNRASDNATANGSFMQGGSFGAPIMTQ